jgi:hypothetical protein
MVVLRGMRGFGRVFALFAVFAVGLAVWPASGLAVSSVPSSSTWVTNDPVESVAVDSHGRVYLGGDFSEVGPRIGHGLSLTTSDDQPAAGWPDVNGPVLAVVSDGTGGWFIGGEFTYVGGVARSGLAHINSDATLDMSWDPEPACDSSCPTLPTGVPAEVDALAVSGGELFVGGSFSSIGDQSVSDLAAVSTSGSGVVDASWAPDPSCAYADASCVNTLVVLGSELFVGGYFTAIGGQSLSNLAELSTSGTGAADATWDPDPNGVVFSLVLSGSELFAGGGFTSIGGQSRSELAELSTQGSGAVDPTWNPNPNRPKMVPDEVNALTLSGSSLFVGGVFERIGGQPRNDLAELSTTGAGDADPNWNPAGISSPAVNALTVSDGYLYVGGSFGLLGGVRQDDLARVSTTGTGAADASWDPNVNGVVDAVAAASSSIYAGGEFTSAGALNVYTNGELVRLNPDGSLDQTWNPDVYGSIEALDVSGGQLYVAGLFNEAYQATESIARISLATGQLDPNWKPDIGTDVRVDTLAISAGDVYIGGDDLLDKLPTTGNGQPDPSWTPNPNGDVSALALSGPELYVGGDFTAVGGQPRNGIAKLSTSGNGSADPNWNPNLNLAYGYSLGPLAVAGNSVYLSGDFAAPNNLFQCGLVELSGDGTGQADPSWNPAPNGCVYASAVADNELYVAGSFSSIGGQARTGLAALSLTGTGDADPSWNPGVGPGFVDDIASVGSLATSGNGLVMGGYFGSIGPYSTSGVEVFGDISLPSVTLTTPANGATYTPGQSVSADYSCSDPGGVVALASCDGPVASGQEIDISTPGQYSFAITATDADGNTRTETATYAVAGPPSASITTPAHNPIYTLGQFIRATYSCQESRYGPGLESCVGTVPDGAPIDTATAGKHQLEVTATSTDGQTDTRTVSYTVLPGNRFVVSRVEPHPNGSTDLLISIPGAGTLDVMETAWDDNRARAADLLQPAQRRFVISRKHLTISRAGNVRIHVTLNRHGETLLHHHRYRVVFRLWISYTPAGGQQRNIGIYDLHFSRSPLTTSSIGRRPTS